ncbi:MAG: ligD, partial [Acidobacteria bacterium]|nr:ligD [Acidobacteriota bacterium]
VDVRNTSFPRELPPLVRRKEQLRGILRRAAASPIRYTSHLDGKGIALFRAACEYDLEGIVAKRKDAPYESDERSTSWIKIKNPQYSQIWDRHELFAQRLFNVRGNGTELGKKTRETLEQFGRGDPPAQTAGLDSPHQSGRSWSWHITGEANHGHRCCQTNQKSHTSQIHR